MDVVEHGVTGCHAQRLEDAVEQALTLNREGVRQGSMKFSWKACADMFASWLVPCGEIPPPRGKASTAYEGLSLSR